MMALSGKNLLRNLALAASGAYACVASMAVQAETTLTYVDQNNSAAEAFVINVQAPYLRMNEAGGMWMLYDSQADVLYAVNPADQSYTKMDRAMAQQLGGVMDAVEEQMKNLPPEQRAAIEQMMGRSMLKNKAKTEYALTGAKRKHAGVECNVGHLIRAGKAKHEFCVADPKALGMSNDDYAVMTKMFELMAALRDSAGGMFSQDMPDPTQMKGVAIESNGRKAGHQIISKVSHDKIAAEQFKIPSNYRQEVIPKLTP